MPVTKRILNNCKINVALMNMYAIVYSCLMESLNAELMKKTREGGCGLRQEHGVAEKSAPNLEGFRRNSFRGSARFIFLHPSVPPGVAPRRSNAAIWRKARSKLLSLLSLFAAIPLTLTLPAS